MKQAFHDHQISDLERITKALDGLSTKGKGRGYGLRTVKELIKQMKGEMVFVSEGFGYYFTDKNPAIVITRAKNGTKVLILIPKQAKITNDKFYQIIEGK